MIRVTIWNEYDGTQNYPHYPEGIHEYLKCVLSKKEGLEVRTAVQFGEGEGLSEEILSSTDVLVYWAHMYHGKLSDEAADRVARHVLSGMGAVFLHSAHMSKPFTRLLGTSCTLKWREANERERLWLINPNHPISKGLPESFSIPCEEMYGERFDIPTPDELVALGWFEGGNVMRSVCVFNRGLGKVVFVQPGHETCPTYTLAEMQLLIENAVRYAAPSAERITPQCVCENIPMEEIRR